jgi:hypothetical protein
MTDEAASRRAGYAMLNQERRSEQVARHARKTGAYETASLFDKADEYLPSKLARRIRAMEPADAMELLARIIASRLGFVGYSDDEPAVRSDQGPPRE